MSRQQRRQAEPMYCRWCRRECSVPPDAGCDRGRKACRPVTAARLYVASPIRRRPMTIEVGSWRRGMAYVYESVTCWRSTVPLIDAEVSGTCSCRRAACRPPGWPRPQVLEAAVPLAGRRATPNTRRPSAEIYAHLAVGRSPLALSRRPANTMTVGLEVVVVQRLTARGAMPSHSTDFGRFGEGRGDRSIAGSVA